MRWFITPNFSKEASMRALIIWIAVVMAVASCRSTPNFMADDVIEEIAIELAKNPEYFNVQFVVRDIAILRLMELAHPDWGRPGYILAERLQDEKVLTMKAQVLSRFYIKQQYRSNADKLVRQLSARMKPDAVKKLSKSFQRLSDDFLQTYDLSDTELRNVHGLLNRVNAKNAVKADEDRLIAEVERMWNFDYDKESKAWMDSMLLSVDPAGGRTIVYTLSVVFQCLSEKLAR